MVSSAFTLFFLNLFEKGNTTSPVWEMLSSFLFPYVLDLSQAAALLPTSHCTLLLLSMPICSILPFLGVPQLPLISLSHMTSSRHTCLNFLLYPAAIRTGWESQIPNSKTSPSLPLFEVMSVYPITPPLSMTQVMFASKHVPVLVLHMKHLGFP